MRLEVDLASANFRAFARLVSAPRLHHAAESRDSSLTRMFRAGRARALRCGASCFFLVAIAACDDREGPKAAPASTSSSAVLPLATVSEVVGARAEIVAEADRLAVEATAQTDAGAGPLLLRAGELRERIWRFERKRVDALEAIELYSASATRDWTDACQAGLRAAVLRGELNADPEQTYRDVYLSEKREPTQACRERADAALSMLAAFRPSDEELARLAHEAGEDTSEPEPDAAHGSHVVVPDVVAKSLEQPATITQVEPYGAEETARIVIHVSHPTKFSVGTLEASGGQEPRLFVDVSKATYQGTRILEVGGLVRRARLGKHDDGTRVVLDLTRPVYHRVFYLPDPFRLVIDVSRDPPENVAEAPTVRRIVLDPGHGGSDPGAIGPNGLHEKDVTLDVAHRAAPLLAREIGVSTLLTRDTDEFVPLDERAARANAFNADLFVSIHCNASPNSERRGVMTFVLDASKDSLAARVAARENSSTEAAAAELANSLSRVSDSKRLAASEHFAELLQRAARSSLGLRYGSIQDHGVRRAGFYVLAGARMPAVLFEGSFISNEGEAERLNTGDYRQRLADSVVNAVRAYREGR